MSVSTEGLRERLGKVSPHAAKLYSRMVEMAYSGRGQARSGDAAYLPELYESCGVTVEEMYEHLEALKSAGLIELEGEYPFEDAKLTDASAARALFEQGRSRGVTASEVINELLDIR